MSHDLRPYYIQRPAPSGMQAYFPSLEVLFPSLQEHTKGSPTLAATELVVDISGTTATVEHLVTKALSTKEIWTRQIHLVDPVDVMAGELILPKDGSLPTFRNAWQTTLRKINDPYNEAYTATVASNLASRLVELDLSPHFCRFYGTYSARVPEYRFNLSDYLEDIEQESWFSAGIKTGVFKVLAVDPDTNEEAPFEPWQPKESKPIITGEDEVSLDSDENSTESESADETLSATSEVGSDDIPTDGEVTLSRPRLRLERSNAISPSSSGSSYSDEPYLNYIAILKDFPVQLTYLERCDGTMDKLMDDEHYNPTPDMIETKDQRWTAWIYQVVAALTVAQHYYDLIHNDLHTNNIVWSGTEETHLYYHVKGSVGGDRFYKVPTYGRIFKIIDFGRATFRVGSGPVWFPDVYAPDADAGGQYNCGEFFDKNKPKVSPNKSFDLCRMAIAMLEAVWPKVPAPVEPVRILTSEPGRDQSETVSPIWNLLWLWLTDKDGKNLLRSPSGRERYPEFDLYCAIAASSENAVPAQQLTRPVFDDAFKVRQKDIPADAKIWTLQAHPPKTKKNKK